VDLAERFLSILEGGELATLLSKICIILSCALQKKQNYIAVPAMSYRLAEASEFEGFLSSRFRRELPGRRFTVFGGSDALFRKEMAIEVRNVVVTNFKANFRHRNACL
jgi:hypothetical protein